MAKKSFFKGAVILGIAGIIVKVFGAFFRIPLANIIGDTGMGYYQTAYPVYVLLLTLSTAGIPTAIARLVSERTTEGNHKEAYRIFTVSFRLLLAMGIVTSLLLFLGAPYIVQYMKGEPEAIYSMRSIAPALLFVPIMAAFRGYFQGQQDMTPTASSQVIEQAFRVVFGLSMAVILLPAGLKFAAAGASAGAAAGGFFGLIGIFAIYMRRRSVIRENCRNSPDGESEAAKSILWKIVVIAVPVTIGAAIMPIMTNIDLAIVVRRLVQSGYSSAEANSLYGQLSGFATPLINLPQVLTQAIAMSLVPAVASAFSAKDQEFLRYNTAFGIRTAMIIGMPCSVGLMVLSKPIMLLLYPAQQASAVNAAESLFILAFGAIFLSLVQTLTGILQGVKRQLIPVINLDRRGDKGYHHICADRNPLCQRQGSGSGNGRGLHYRSSAQLPRCAEIYGKQTEFFSDFRPADAQRSYHGSDCMGDLQRSVSSHRQYCGDDGFCVLRRGRLRFLYSSV